MADAEKLLPKPTLQELQLRIAELLVNGSVYRAFRYDGSGESTYFKEEHSMSAYRFGLLPKQVKMYCSSANCRQDTICEAGDPQVYFDNKFHQVIYTCRNCGSNSQHYWFMWMLQRDVAIFMKVGQYPALSIEPSKELSKALGEQDTALYKKALINGNYSFGIGALVYFRRVIENEVNMLLDMIAEAARLANFEPEELKRIEEIKSSHHVDVKIEYASKILPLNLRPGGHNPLNKLYAIASTGIHGKSDEECLDDFNNARFEFEYLFKNLTTGNEEAREYLARLASPPKKPGN